MPKRGMTHRPPSFRVDYSHPLAEGLVFAGLGQHAGSTHYHDGSAYGNHGTMSNMTPTRDWEWISELSRESVAGRAEITGIYNLAPSFTATFPFAIAVWFTLRIRGQFDCICQFTTNGGTGIFNISIASDYSLYYVQGGSARNLALTANADQWYHVALCFDSSSSVRAYADGISIAVAQPVGDFTPANPIVSLMRLYDVGTTSLRGSICDPMAYNRALSDAEIARLADPSNVDLDGMIQRVPSRRYFYAPSTGNRRRRLLLCGAAA